MTTEAFARVKIDELLRDAGWRLTDGQSIRFEYSLSSGGRAHYVLFLQFQTAFAEHAQRIEATARALDDAAAKAEAMAAGLSAEVFGSA